MAKEVKVDEYGYITRYQNMSYEGDAKIGKKPSFSKISHSFLDTMSVVTAGTIFKSLYE